MAKARVIHILPAGCAHQDLVGVPAAARGRRMARRLELLALPLFQLAPHALIAVSVMAHPDAFSARVRAIAISEHVLVLLVLRYQRVQY